MPEISLIPVPAFQISGIISLLLSTFIITLLHWMPKASSQWFPVEWKETAWLGRSNSNLGADPIWNHIYFENLISSFNLGNLWIIQQPYGFVEGTGILIHGSETWPPTSLVWWWDGDSFGEASSTCPGGAVFAEWFWPPAADWGVKAFSYGVGRGRLTKPLWLAWAKTVIYQSFSGKGSW